MLTDKEEILKRIEAVESALHELREEREHVVTRRELTVRLEDLERRLVISADVGRVGDLNMVVEQKRQL